MLKIEVEFVANYLNSQATVLYVATMTDTPGMEGIKGHGDTVQEAINDLESGIRRALDQGLLI